MNEPSTDDYDDLPEHDTYFTEMEVWKKPLAAFLEKWFGKCPDFEPNCASCQRWKAFKLLTQDVLTPDTVSGVTSDDLD